MGSDHPSPSAGVLAERVGDAAKRERAAGGTRGRSIRLALAAIAPAALLIGYELLGAGVQARMAVAHLVLTVAPAAALGALLAAIWAAPRGRRTSWLWFAAAAGVGLAGQVLATLEYIGRVSVTGFPSPSFILFTAFYPLFISGLLSALRGSTRTGLNRDTMLDATVIVAVTAVLLLRFAVEPIWATSSPTGWRFGLMLLTPALAVLSFCVSAVLLLWRGVSSPDRVLASLAGAGFAFASGNLMLLAWVGPGGSPIGSPVDLVWLAGWVCLAVAGFAGASPDSWIIGTSAPGRLAELLRRSVIPGAAIFLGVIGLHSALRPPGLISGGAIAVLGAVLALRIAKALQAAQRRGEEHQEMVHTRALAELSHELASVYQLERTLELVAESARRLLNARSAIIELVSEDRRQLEVRAIAGLPDAIVGLQFPISGSFTGWVVRHGRPRATADATRDPTIQPQSLPFLGATPVAAAPLRHRDRTVGALGIIRNEPFDPDSLRLLQLLADRAGISIENARLFDQVEALSMTDPLTGLANRRQLDRDLAREFAAATRGRRLVAVVFDLDGFKGYNDRHGHLAGDEALRLFGEVICIYTRAMNLAARYGGDEFVALLADTDLEGARVFVDRVSERFAEESELLGRGPLKVSAGLAEYSPDMREPDELIAAADAALYRRKAERSRT